MKKMTLQKEGKNVRQNLLELRQYIGVAPYVMELRWTYWSCGSHFGERNSNTATATPICPLLLNNFHNESYEIFLFHCRSSIS